MLTHVAQIDMLTNNLKELINEVKEEKKRQHDELITGKKIQRAKSQRRKQLGQTAVNLFANV